MKVVLDANVLVAAFGFGGVCRAVVEVCIDSHGIVLSEHILEEVRRHLQDRFHHAPSTAEQRVALLREVAQIVEQLAVPPDACRDPDDLPVVGTVLASGADCLVTGDKDLLALGQIAGRPIFSPREFWQRLR